MSAPLHGLRVIDCSRGAAGLIASGFLADQGADVVWVEPPGGDPLRCRVPEYAVYNRSKRSIELDLKSSAGRASLDRLLGSADVLLAAWGSGVAQRLGLDERSLRSRHAHLVTCSITPYGNEDPDPERKGYEALVSARMCCVYHQDGHRPGPIFLPAPFLSLSAAELALSGIFAALFRREDDGWGRHVEVSMVEGALAIVMGWWADSEAPPSANPGARGPTRRLIVQMFRCGDGEYVAINTGATGAHDRLMNVLGLSDRVKPATSPIEVTEPLSAAEGELLQQELPRIFASRRRDDWVADIVAADVCALPVLRPGQIFRERQPLHNGMVVQVDDPDLGSLLQVGTPVRFRGMPLATPLPAPRAGQHGAALLSEERPPAPPPRTGTITRRTLLEGVKVLDAGIYLAGPFTGRLLADLGADVVKLESLAGDPNRSFVLGDLMTMRGKRSIAVDLKSPEGRDIGGRLTAWADVVMHNMRPGAAERLGLGEEQVRERNPDVVYMAAPGWGSSGPDMQRQAFAPMLSAYVGLQYEVAGRGNAPLYPAMHEDPVNGMWGAAAATMGLYLRKRGARRLYAEYPLLNAAMTLVQHIMMRADTGELLGARRLDAEQTGFDPRYRLYGTEDGWVCVAAVTDAQAGALMTALGAPALDEPALARAFSARRTEEVAAALAAHRVPHEVVPEPSIRDAFLRGDLPISEGRVSAYHHPIFGETRQAVERVRSPDAPPAEVRRPCLLGEHTREVLAMLGYDEATIDRLHEAKVVRSARRRDPAGAAAASPVHDPSSSA